MPSKKSLVILLTALCLYGTANSETITTYGFDDDSCGAWVKSEGNVPVRSLYYSWFRGFVTGHNYGNYANPKKQVRLERLSNETLQLYISKFCQDHPLDPFTFAAYHLVKESQGNRDPR